MYIVNIDQGMKFYYNRISAQWPQNKSKATKYETISIYSELEILKKTFPELHLEIE